MLDVEKVSHILGSIAGQKANKVFVYITNLGITFNIVIA